MSFHGLNKKARQNIDPMEIIIREPRRFFGEDYQIKVTDTNEQFEGENIGFFMFDHIILSQGQRKIITAKRRFKPFRKMHFDIVYKETKGHFKQLTWFKPTYEMVLGNLTYDIIKHWGKKVSIFDGSKQIASVVQVNDISFNNNDTHKLLVNDNIDYVPLMLTAMILDAPNNESSSNNMLVIDLGNMSGEQRAFDYHWKPSAT